MPTTFANTIDNNEILAKRSQCDYAGNDIQTTYATKSELPSASQLVPASTPADASKVLTVDSQGIPGWAAGGSGGGGNVFMATSTTTFPELWQAFHEDGKIVYCTSGSASALSTPYFLQTLKANDSSHTTGTATFVQFNRYSTGRIEVYHSTVTFSSNRPTLGTVTFTRQTIVPDNPKSHVGEFLSASSSGDMVFATVNQVPAATSADVNKVLTVDSSGNAEWVTPSGGGSVTDVEVNGTSVVNASGVAEVTVPAQVQPDWDATSGLGEILNKPTILPYKPVVAGTGVRIVDDTANNRIVVEADETVLYEAPTDAGTTLELNQYVTLSESMTHFERVRIYYAVQKAWTGKQVFECYMVDGDVNVNLHDVWYREQSGFNVWYETLTYNKYTDSDMKFTQSGGVQRAILNSTWNTTSGLTTVVYKIVGINRISN